MSKKKNELIKVELILPITIINYINSVAEQAGLAPDQVVRVLLAADVVRLTQVTK